LDGGASAYSGNRSGRQSWCTYATDSGHGNTSGKPRYAPRSASNAAGKSGDASGCSGHASGKPDYGSGSELGSGLNVAEHADAGEQDSAVDD
jgi:hypothetical protein